MEKRSWFKLAAILIGVGIALWIAFMLFIDFFVAFGVLGTFLVLGIVFLILGKVFDKKPEPYS